MLFNSYQFLLIFLPLAILVYALADQSPRLRTWVLIALSLAFYGYWDVRFLPLMVFSILINWFAAQLYAATRRHGIITAAIAGNLLLLGFFKYTNFLAQSFATLLGWKFDSLALVLPLGISFFTFHHIMYLVDLGRGTAPPYPLDRYALYICFFPQAIAGPIARWSEVMDQFGQRVFAPGWERRCAIGAMFVVLGLVQKVFIGDPLGRAIDPVFAKALVGPVTSAEAWIAPAFALQVFFDFSGYSDIAIGLALIFGIQLPRNFDAPYRATSIRDFWRRWHMTLSRFLRDYVYIPLGGSYFGIRQQIAALLATMALCGLWHGAGWTFVIWGLLHGLALTANVLYRRYFPPLPAAIGWAATFTFVVLTFVMFRAGSLDAAGRIYEAMLGWPTESLHRKDQILFALLAALALPPTHEICSRLMNRPRMITAVAASAAVVGVLLLIHSHASHEFIYFQF